MQDWIKAYDDQTIMLPFSEVDYGKFNPLNENSAELFYPQNNHFKNLQHEFIEFLSKSNYRSNISDIFSQKVIAFIKKHLNLIKQIFEVESLLAQSDLYINLCHSCIHYVNAENFFIFLSLEKITTKDNVSFSRERILKVFLRLYFVLLHLKDFFAESIFQLEVDWDSLEHMQVILQGMYESVIAEVEQYEYLQPVSLFTLRACQMLNKDLFDDLVSSEKCRLHFESIIQEQFSQQYKTVTEQIQVGNLELNTIYKQIRTREHQLKRKTTIERIKNQQEYVNQNYMPVSKQISPTSHQNTKSVMSKRQSQYQLDETSLTKITNRNYQLENMIINNEVETDEYKIRDLVDNDNDMDLEKVKKQFEYMLFERRFQDNFDKAQERKKFGNQKQLQKVQLYPEEKSSLAYAKEYFKKGQTEFETTKMGIPQPDYTLNSTLVGTNCSKSQTQGQGVTMTMNMSENDPSFGDKSFGKADKSLEYSILENKYYKESLNFPNRYEQLMKEYDREKKMKAIDNTFSDIKKQYKQKLVEKAEHMIMSHDYSFEMIYNDSHQDQEGFINKLDQELMRTPGKRKHKKDNQSGSIRRQAIKVPIEDQVSHIIHDKRKQIHPIFKKMQDEEGYEESKIEQDEKQEDTFTSQYLNLMPKDSGPPIQRKEAMMLAGTMKSHNLPSFYLAQQEINKEFSDESLFGDESVSELIDINLSRIQRRMSKEPSITLDILNESFFKGDRMSKAIHQSKLQENARKTQQNSIRYMQNSEEQLKLQTLLQSTFRMDRDGSEENLRLHSYLENKDMNSLAASLTFDQIATLRNHDKLKGNKRSLRQVNQQANVTSAVTQKSADKRPVKMRNLDQLKGIHMYS